MSDILDIFNRTTTDISPYEQDFTNAFYEIKNVLQIKNNLELSISIITEEEQIELNKKFRHKDYVADVLTFPLNQVEDNNIIALTNIISLGDIFICYKQAERQASLYQHSLRRELIFLFVHGMLHILGYDHMNFQDEKIMFGLQTKILNNLQIYRNQLK